ncbi:MAG TPA: farnesyl diphosphate synthase [Gammaproteobacteria bacterium]|nr:farnesyl diphosphate synthase [Gammaproteobacteria bacterium]
MARDAGDSVSPIIPSGNTLDSLLSSYQRRVEQALEQRLPNAQQHPAALHQAMRYAVLGGGKHLRPILVYASGACLGAELESLDAPACAVEMIHAYSLVHDDLPAMDNDDLRRGKPTCHKAFGEATAILAGNALLTLAFQILAVAPGVLPPATLARPCASQDPALQASAVTRLKMIEILAEACGSHGLAGGQEMDLAAVGKTLSLAELEHMHHHKTGALIRASVLLGAWCAAELDSALLERLDRYAQAIGLAFQIRDDILDEEGETQVLGKTAGADRALNKPTYPAIVGMAEAKRMADEQRDIALASIKDLDPRADPLRWIADYIVERSM